MIRRFKPLRKIMPLIALCVPYNWKRGRWQYPQLWPVASKCARKLSFQKRGSRRNWLNRRIKKTIEWFCGTLTGHEISKTEWEYGGGNFVDRHCRWCDKLFRIPKREEFVPRGLEDMADSLGWSEDWKGGGEKK